MRLPSPEVLGMASAVMSGVAEAWHGVRMRRLGRLGFGVGGGARRWVMAVPWMRALACGMLAWGLATLLGMGTFFVRPQEVPEGGWRHLVIALDVSPSMQLKDAGAGRSMTRARRASELVMSLLGRVALDQVRVSVVAFYTGARPVVVDCMDVEVVRNILDDLPLEIAFEPGKTSLMEGVRVAGELGKGWGRGTATLMVVSDGDTVPDQGLGALPPAFGASWVVGVGDAAGGQFIDGHQSRQDAGALRQLAGRLQGMYHDGNARHLPSAGLAALSRVMPMRDGAGAGRRQWAMAATGTGAGVLALMPVALALFGARGQPARCLGRRRGRRDPGASAQEHPSPENP